MKNKCLFQSSVCQGTLLACRNCHRLYCETHQAYFVDSRCDSCARNHARNALPDINRHPLVLRLQGLVASATRRLP